MDKIRLTLWFALMASLWLSYVTWVNEHQPEPAAEPPPVTADSQDGGAPPALDNDVPAGAADNGGAELPASSDAPLVARARRTIEVHTDVFDATIDLDGGDLVAASLPGYPVDKKTPDVYVQLLNDDPAMRFVFQTGIVSPGDAPEPNHQASFRADDTVYRLADGADTLEVRLQWVNNGPVQAEKVYTFRRGQYEVDLDLVVRNGSSVPWEGAAYAQINRLYVPVKRHYASVETYSFNGPVLYNGSEYQKLDFEDLAQSPVMEQAMGGWVASIQHHFLAAAIPPPDDDTRLDALVSGQSYRLTARGPVKAVPAGAEMAFPVKLFVGPKIQSQLRATSPELDLTVDYGKLTFLSHPLFLLLNFIHSWVGNWGWAIVLSTLVIKLAFYKLTATSGRSMAKMRKIAPRMKALQEKHKDDRQALSQAMMDLYKREKVNPAAGCLPILIQMPVFFAFYRLLVETAEMRQAPFLLWINDLSSRDPFFVLPILMGAAMLFQMRLNPAPPDPVQARVMQIMPLLFTGMFALFPAGMVVYYLTNTVASIAQQWRINKLVERES